MAKNSAISVKKQVVIATSTFFTLIFIGTILFRHLENWTWGESFYYSVVTLTTVGYGDLTPTTDTSRLVAAFYILLGVTIAVSAVSIIGSGYMKRRVNLHIRRHDNNSKQD